MSLAPPLPEPKDPPLRRLADALRALAMDAVEKAKSGHPGMPMGMADIAAVLFTRFLRFDPQAPDWPDRDRFVLSNGHGSMLLYGLLHLLGYPEMTMAEIERFRQLGSRTAGHPERGDAAGIEVTTGPLGQGLANAVGMAIAERMLAAEFGDDVVDHRTYVCCGDGCLMEGISHEAASLAGHLRLGKADRALRRQRDLDRRPDRTRRFRRPARTLSRPWLARRAHRRPRHRGDRCGARPRAAERPAEPHRLPYGHRLWRADQGRHRRGAWRRTRRRRDRRSARAPRLELSAFRRPRGCRHRLARGRKARRAGAPGLGRTTGGAAGGAARRVSAPATERDAGRARCRDRRTLRRFPQGRGKTRDAPGLGHRARPSDREPCRSWSAARPI